MSDSNKQTFWKGPGHYDVDSEAESYRRDEFPHRESIPDVDRRDAMKLMGASLALAGLATSGCRSLIMPQMKIVGAVQSPENRTTGIEQHFATTYSLSGDAVGLLVTSYEGRPVKIEGNPKHPASLGSVDAKALASILNLYDPDRLTTVQTRNDRDNWDNCLKALRKQLKDVGGVAILTEKVTSPTLAKSIEEFLTKSPGAEWFQYEPVNNDNVREGMTLAVGQVGSLVYDFSKADLVVSLDCDVFHELPGAIRHQREVMQKRRVDSTEAVMSRLYTFESVPTTFGAMSDHRTPLRASQMLALARALAGALGAGPAAAPPAGVDSKLFAAMVRDIESKRGAALVVPGRHLPPAVHAAVHAINAAIGAMGQAVTVVPAVHPWDKHAGQSISALATKIQSGAVKTLLIIGGNPLFTAPADLKFGELMKQVPFTFHLSEEDNETGHECLWQAPMSHYLEAWGDAVAYDGTVSLQQPLIAPLYDSRSAIEFFASLNGRAADGRAEVLRRWPALGDEFSDAWVSAVGNGVVPNTKAAPATVAIKPNLMSALPDAPAASGYELRFEPDLGIHDGRYANNGWLMEWPRPMTNLTWDNAVEMSLATAKKLGVSDGKRFLGIPMVGNAPMMDVTVEGRTVSLPVLIHLGMAEDVLLVRYGFGRTRAGQTGTKGDPMKRGGGFNAYALRGTKSMTMAAGVDIKRGRGEYPLANAQFHNTLDVKVYDSGRDIIKSATLEEFKKDTGVFAPTHHFGKNDEKPLNQGFVAAGATTDAHTEGAKGEAHSEKELPSVYDGKDFEELYAKNYQWAMTVDLNLCTGCGACVIACQSENNIPTVGKRQVMQGREMHWIRIDRYYRGDGKSLDEANPPIYFQPLACVHCEQAPCEPVCPVAATVHSSEGLNQMVYNRCVGTRYCSNNCPYKVRRFNFLHYTQNLNSVPVLQLLQNPDVTVRGRGVMEKCTYCVQRINGKRIAAKLRNEKLKDGEVVTACQQACPAQAIVFGDKNDPNSRVSKERSNPRDYTLLDILNVRPRTTYLGRVHNPNPEVNA